jgi:hypothetical protein
MTLILYPDAHKDSDFKELVKLYDETPLCETITNISKKNDFSLKDVLIFVARHISKGMDITTTLINFLIDDCGWSFENRFFSLIDIHVQKTFTLTELAAALKNYNVLKLLLDTGASRKTVEGHVVYNKDGKIFNEYPLSIFELGVFPFVITDHTDCQTTLQPMYGKVVKKSIVSIRDIGGMSENFTDTFWENERCFGTTGSDDEELGWDNITFVEYPK